MKTSAAIGRSRESGRVFMDMTVNLSDKFFKHYD